MDVCAGGGGDVGGVFSVPNQSVFKKIYVHSGGGGGGGREYFFPGVNE